MRSSFVRQLLEREEAERKRVAQAIHDGMGFDVAAARQRDNNGLGLARMEEHAKAFGGELKLVFVPGQGTRLRVTFPMPESLA